MKTTRLSWVDQLSLGDNQVTNYTTHITAIRPPRKIQYHGHINFPMQDLEQLFEQGVLHHHNNELEDACRIYHTILDEIPDSPLVNYNLGLALFQAGNFEHSYTHYKEALLHAPQEIDVLYNLALCTRKLGYLKEAIELYQHVLTLQPEDVDSLYNLGCCYTEIGREDRAMELYQQVLSLEQNHTSALNNIAFLCHKNEEYNWAESYYTRLLAIQPDHHAAGHLLSSLRGDRCRIAPARYIEEIFDNYSTHYDTSLLQELKYDIPNIMRHRFDTLFSPAQGSLDILDLGCGTGLAGEAFHDLCASLTGVDLSSKMIAIAEQKHLYDRLHTGEISSFIKNCTHSYSCILATDVFTYIGDISPIFAMLGKNSQKDTIFCFSTERTDSHTYALCKTGRFAHSQPYIESIARQSGWSVIHSEIADIRKEKDEWIAGTIFFTVKV